MQLDQAFDQREPDAEPALRAVARAVTCANMSKIVRQQLPARCRCPCRATRSCTSPSAACAHGDLMPPPGSVYFAALFSRLPTDLREPQRVASRPDRLAPAASTAWCRLRVDRRAARSRCGVDDAPAVERARAQLELAAGDARDIEQIVEQPRHVLRPAARSRSRLRASVRASPRRARKFSRLRIGARGLRSSCASVARNSSLRRSASRSWSRPPRGARFPAHLRTVGHCQSRWQPGRRPMISFSASSVMRFRPPVTGNSSRDLRRRHTEASREMRPSAAWRAPADSSAPVASARRRPVSPPPERTETEAWTSLPPHVAGASW